MAKRFELHELNKAIIAKISIIPVVVFLRHAVLVIRNYIRVESFATQEL